MEQLINYLAIIFAMIFVDVGAFYVAWRKMKSTERVDGTQMLKDLQDIADRAVKAQRETSEEREILESRIAQLESQIRVLMQGDLRVELVIGGNPKIAKFVRIENVVSLPTTDTNDQPARVVSSKISKGTKQATAK